MRLMAMMQAGVFRDEDFEDVDSQEEDEEEDYEDEVEQHHAMELMAHASKLIAQVGDPNIAIELMRLDEHDKRLLIRTMQEQYFLQQQR